MATYTITSKTLWGNTCKIALTTQSGNGGELLPASEPFEMETDDSTDIDTVLRPTTGTVRFIVEDASVLDNILPTSLLDTKVEVWLGDTLKFYGYVEITEYSQPWDSTPYEVELPVRDIVSLLEDIYIEPKDDSYFGRSLCFPQYLTEAMNILGFEPERVYIEGSSNYNILTQPIQREWFLSEDASYDENGTKSMGVSGCSYAEALEKMLLPNSMSLRFGNGYLILRRQYESDNIYYLSWSDFTAITKDSIPSPSRSSYTIHSGGTGFSDQGITNMSANNTMDHLTPYRSVMVDESLEDSNVFQLNSEWCGEWTMFAASYHRDSVDDKCAFLWENTGITQRQVSVPRYTLNTYGVADTVPTTAPVDIQYNGSDIVGGVLIDLSTYSYTDRAKQSSIPLPSTPQIASVPIKIQLTESQGPVLGLSCADFYCPVSINPSKGGCLCFNANVELLYSQTLGNGTVVPCPGNKPEDSGTFLYAMVELVDEDGDSMVCRRDNYKVGWAPPTEELVTDAARIIFDNNGSVVPNHQNIGETTVSMEGGHIGSTYAEPLTQGERFVFKECEGYIMPFTGFDLPDKEYRLHVRLFSPYLSANERYGDGPHCQWMIDHGVWQIISNIKITWHPVTIESKSGLPSPGDDDPGSFDAKYLNLPEDKTYTFAAAVNNGEDLTVSVDSWGDGDGVKWNNTLQPDILDRAGWQSVAKQHVNARRIIVYDDARYTAGLFDQFIVDGKTYIRIGDAWKASNEGGEKKFVELL